MYDVIYWHRGEESQPGIVWPVPSGRVDGLEWVLSFVRAGLALGTMSGYRIRRVA